MTQYKNPPFQIRPLCAALLAALAAPLSLTGHAQEKQAEEADKVTVYGKKDYITEVSAIGGDIRDIPQSISIINQAVLGAQAVTTLTEALRNTPGITLSAGEGGNIGDNVNIRGYSARTDLFLDGIRDRGQYNRETFFLESVEVLRGPSSMLFGRGSTGGVINQVSKQANLEDRMEVGVSGGTEAYYRATLDVNRKISDSSAYRVVALGHNNESTRDIAQSERTGLAGSLRFGIDAATEIGVTAIVQRRDDIPDYGVPVGIPGVDTGGDPLEGTIENPAQPVATDAANFYGFTDDEFTQDVDVFSVRIDHEFSESMSFSNKTQYNSATIHAMPTRINMGGPGGTDIETQFTRDRRERDVEDEMMYNQTDLVIHIGNGGVQHTLTLGAEVGRDYYNNQAYLWDGETPQSIVNPVYGPMPASAARIATTFTDNESETTAFYLNDQISLGEHWKLVAGVRMDNFDFSSTVVNNPTPENNGVFAKDESMTSHRAGIIYQPSDTQSYYVSTGTSFNPSAEALTLNVSNLLVDPEENESKEIGAKWDLLNGGLSVTTSFFEVEKTNARNTDPETDLVELDGSTRVEGYEIGVSGRLNPVWQIFAAYTNLDGEIVRLDDGDGLPLDGNVLQNTPEHTASLWTVYEGSTWEIGGGAVYSSERMINNNNTAVTDGYTRYDAMASWQYDEQYQVQMNLQNLTDEEYFEVATGGRATPTTGSVVIMSWNARF